ncbi:MFS transporter [Bradyrhizobium sp. CCBAU 53338]|uniref:MFS transporter n=1 Tax=Bradyrhizobium sp. CCBAU 53338 TaxID=1325111 RepID=UPI00188CCFE6|nr:MFS transporter [Bradyrhizobium sp. CCBAU 53338]QOZ52432.1 MFS transporter [Bradyrhizobium sp. CCBAU 53338]
MENSRADRLTPTALMLGNLVTGCSVLAPAGMLPELSEGLGISVRTAGLLITFGAITLCIGSPVTAWLTSRIERRLLLTATLAVLALGNLASAFAPDYASLLVIRLVMLAVGALYTPQAAGTAALIVPAERRGSTIAYIFLGWSLAAAVGLPLITFIASRYGWRAAYGEIGALGCVSFLLLLVCLPAGLKGTPVDLKTWREVGRSKAILLLLAITMLQMSGQFAVFTFMGPLLKKLIDASPDAIGLVFGIYGVCGFLGVVVASRIVDTWGPYRTSLLFTSLLLAGIAGWALSAGTLVLMAVGVAIWGLGFASTNSMQQVRLVAAAPPLAPATVALNTSVLYIGQAIGSAVGGLLFARDLLHSTGFVAVGFVVLALVLVVASRPRPAAAVPG